MIRVSVVIPTYKRPDLLARCLRALLKQTMTPSEFEVIVADDDADPRINKLIDLFNLPHGPSIRYVAVTETHGPAAARNQGWRQARGQIIAFTDDDCIPNPDWLAEGIDSFESRFVALSGQLVMPLPSNPTDYERDASHLQHSSFVTANCFVRKSRLQMVGGFDERFRRAWREDSDLEFRLRQTGLIKKAPQAVVVHPIRPAPWGVSLKQLKNNFYEALLFKKYPQLYRSEIRPLHPWSYYIGVGGLITAFLAAVFKIPLFVFFGIGVWAGLTLEFCIRRLKDTRRSFSHILEMFVTSVLIPPLAIFWRLRGAFHFRVLFL